MIKLFSSSTVYSRSSSIWLWPNPLMGFLFKYPLESQMGPILMETKRNKENKRGRREWWEGVEEYQAFHRFNEVHSSESKFGETNLHLLFLYRKRFRQTISCLITSKKQLYLEFFFFYCYLSGAKKIYR